MIKSNEGMNTQEVPEILKMLYFFNKINLRSLNLIIKRLVDYFRLAL